MRLLVEHNALAHECRHNGYQSLDYVMVFSERSC